MHLAPNPCAFTCSHPCLSEPQFTVQSGDDMGQEELPSWRLRSEALGMPSSSLPSHGVPNTAGAQFPICGMGVSRSLEAEVQR